MEHTDAFVRSEGVDKAIVRCAFHDEHTDPNKEGGTVARNPDAHSHEFGSISCSHTCKDRYDPADYIKIKKYVDDGILPVEWLEDPKWMDPLPHL